MTQTKVTSDLTGTTIEAVTLIDQSRATVWKVLKVPGEIQAFHPLIKNSKMTSAAQSRDGSIRRCELRPMGVMEERISKWTEESGFSTEVIGGKMLPPFNFMHGHLRLEPRGRQTQVSFVFHYQLKYGFIGRLMDATIIRPQFKGAPKKYVEGLKRYVEELQSSDV